MNPAKKMNTRAYLRAAIFLFLICISQTAFADLIVLKNGNHLKVEKAWLEDDQVWFIFSDIKVSIPQSKVTRIESNSSNLAKSDTPENQRTAKINGSLPQPAEKILPNPIKQTAETSADPQQLTLSTKKPLVLRKDGFGDMKWGTRLAHVGGLEIKQIDSGLNDVIEYVRPQDALKLGDATLQSVVYAFWRDQLYTVTIWTQGQENYNALRDTVSNRFGKGTRIDGSSEKYLWSDSTTDMMLKYAKDGQDGMLWMRGKELDRKLKLSRLNGHTSYLKWMKSSK
jgi:hypothetical protein